jgi:hypothetical protein
MSEGVHEVQHQVEHHIKHQDAHGGGHHWLDNFNKKIALLIGVMALLLAFSETLGKSAQTSALSSNIEAGNLWAFFQAKTIRRTAVLTAAEAMTAAGASITDETSREAITKQVAAWLETAARYRSEPEVQEGTVELAQRAKAAEQRRDTDMARYHHYEVASAALQIGIVLASATVITGMLMLTWLALGLSSLGLVFMMIGLLAPQSVHLF